MVGGDASVEGFDLSFAAGVGVLSQKFVDGGFELGGFAVVDEAEGADVFDGAIAAPTAKDKVNGRQHLPFAQLGDDVADGEAVTTATAAVLAAPAWFEAVVECVV